MALDITAVRRRAPGSTFFFSDKSRQILYRLMEWKTFQRGTVLFSMDDPADKLFLIAEGEVKIWKEADGKEYVYQIAGEGDLIGEGGFAESRCTYKAEALEEGRAGVILYKDIEQAVACSHEFAVDMLKWMSLMERTAKAKLRDLTFYGKKGALCSTLIRLAHTYGRQEGGGFLIEKKIKNGEIGSYIGSSRESVNRMLAELKKEAVISQKEGLLIIHDMNYLKKACRCEECPAGVCRM